ncbi:MAG: HU family DNA-binding protein [Chromatiales bacterium]|nr:HU family DNA-binding protein [Chromatiales bacterium]
MTKSELSTQVAAQASLTKASADAAVNAVFSAITDALANGETVTLTGFGTFTVRSREARQGRNPRTGESITIAASRVPAFKASKALRDAVN